MGPRAQGPKGLAWAPLGGLRERGTYLNENKTPGRAPALPPHDRVAHTGPIVSHGSNVSGTRTPRGPSPSQPCRTPRQPPAPKPQRCLALVAAEGALHNKNQQKRMEIAVATAQVACVKAQLPEFARFSLSFLRFLEVFYFYVSTPLIISVEFGVTS